MKKIELTLIVLDKTCLACPEQYDVYFNSFKIGYLRLRHGSFSVSTDSFVSISEYHPRGDGIFDEDEREEYLGRAVLDLLNHYQEKYECLKPIKIIVS